MMADDLENFIKEHKAKLARDKEEVTPRSNRAPVGNRQQWNKQVAQNMPIATEIEDGEETGLPVGGYEQRRRKLQGQRHEEYNQFLAQQHAAPHTQTRLSTPEETGLPLGGYEEKRKKLQEERSKEYNKMIYQKNGIKRHPGLKENIPPKPGTPEAGLISQMGKYDNKRKQLQEERKKEYNQLKGQQAVRSGRQAGTPDEEEFMASLPGLRDRESAQRRRDEQKRDYNEYLSQTHAQEKEASGRPPPPDHDENEDEGLTLPGVRDHPSAEREKMFIRNKEYNQFLQSRQNRGRGGRDDDGDDYARDIRERGPRRGWATPTYEEILEKKRQEERNYRHDDPYYDGGMRASRSEGNLYLDDRRFQNLDREYESKRVRFRNPDRGSVDPDTEFSNWPSRASRDADRGFQSQDRSRDRESDYRPPAASRARNRGYPEDNDREHTTLPIGNEARMSATQRKKEAYRRELEQQMAERMQAKKRERAEELRVDATGAMDVGRRPDRTELPAPPTRRSPPPSRRSPPPTRNNPYQDDFSPRTIIYDDLHRAQGRPPGGGILENGFQGLLGNNMPFPRTNPAPNGYLLPSGLAPGVQGQPALGPYNSPLDEAYYYYGLRNPLEPGLVPAPGLAPQTAGLPMQQTSPSSVRDTIPPPQPDRTASRRDGAAARVAGMPFPTEDTKQRATADAKLTYQQELQKQIEEARLKKQREKEEKERYDRKIEEEAARYDPYGKGGGGAPMKDSQGNIIASRKPGVQPQQQETQPPQEEQGYRGRFSTDLRQMKLDNDSNMLSGRPTAAQTEPPPPNLTPRDPGPEGPSHARGGHGIFGVAKTEEQKTAADKYKDELRQQIEEKKRKQMEEKEKERLEEEREMRRLEEQQKKIKHEYDEELRKQKEKEERTRRENEAMKQQAEEKKKQLEQQRKEAEEKRLEEQRREQEERRKQREQEQAARKSPPLPALRPKLEQEHERTASPPVPALRSKTEPLNSGEISGQPSRAPSRSQSADVLAQLAKMRAQLQNERKRVENALDGQQKDVDVSDPRIQKPPSRRDNLDIFEIARNKEPVSVRRDPANPKHLKDFQNLKHKGNTGSRQELRQDYPDDPITNDALEQQQLALLRAQEEKLRALQQQPSPYEKALPNMNPKDLGLFRDPSLGSITPLQAESEFIAVPDDDEVSLRNHRNQPSRSGRRNRSQTPMSYKDPMGSVISLDPEVISRRNDQRLRKLKNLTGDDISTGDPDDILDRFMAKQKHNRPPSGQTLNDDTWLQSGNKN